MADLFFSIAVQIGRSKKGSLAWDWPQAGGVVFSKLSKLLNQLNQEDVLGAPCYTVVSGLRRRLRGVRKCCE
jgi:hypothetical protein